MCGFAGILDVAAATPEQQLRDDADAMASVVAHRGPDARGTWVDAAAGVALGHRRLSIIDLSPAGAQPMVSASGRYVLAYNGEIYNHRELRRRLEAAGHSFRGRSDTEVLVEAISAWGLEEALSRSNGMFALALWDAERRVLRLARDRIGEKPLYHGRFGTTHLFGSELGALRAHRAFDAEVDRGVLARYLRLGFVPSPHSILGGVRKVPPGTVVTLSTSGAGPAEPYWSVRDVVARAREEPFDGSERDAVDSLDALLADAVTRRLEADVPLGAFLSGGIDSSTVVALMQAAAGRPVRTFTVRFPGDALDEADHAAAVARHLGTDHTEIDAGPADALDAVASAPSVYDEPFADPSQLPTMLLCAAARRHVTVALSGDGGDEVFAGYNRYVFGPGLWERARRLPPGLGAVAGRGLDVLSPSQWDAALGRLDRLLPARLRTPNPGDKLQKVAAVLRARRDEGVHSALVSHWSDPEELVPGAREAAVDWGGAVDGEGALESMMLADTVVTLPDDMLVKVDRASMAVGLEARVPLLDHRVVELAWRLPAHLKLRDGRGKWALRAVLDRYVPATLVDRPKTGFDPPLAAWLRGPLRPWAEELLDPARLRREGYLSPEPVRRRWEEHLSGRRNRDYALWAVLAFQAWLEAAG